MRVIDGSRGEGERTDLSRSDYPTLSRCPRRRSCQLPSCFLPILESLVRTVRDIRRIHRWTQRSFFFCCFSSYLRSWGTSFRSFFSFGLLSATGGRARSLFLILSIENISSSPFPTLTNRPRTNIGEDVAESEAGATLLSRHCLSEQTAWSCLRAK